MHSDALDLLLVASLVFIGAGFFYRKNECHVIRAAGWALFGLYWFGQFPYWIAKDEGINALGTGAALPVFCFLAFHEYLSYRWNEEYEPLRFLAGACFFASAGFFIIEKIPAISVVFIYLVATQTAWLINVFTPAGYYVSSIDMNGNSLWYLNTNNDVTAYFRHGDVMSTVTIILACTGIQAIVASVAFLASTRSERKRRAKAVLLIVPAVYIVNLFRNALVIYSTDFSVLGPSTFDIVHGIIGKIVISMTTLVILMVAAFIIVPEFYESINGAFELPWRRTPGHDYKKYIGRLLGGRKDMPGGKKEEPFKEKGEKGREK